MSDSQVRTPYHPRWLRPRMSTYWWLTRRAYLAFIVRELSSIFVAWFVVYLLMLIHAVTEGAADYQQFLAWSARPLVVLLNVIALLFIVFHAITWFNLAPQAMAIRVAGKRVPGLWVAASNYLAWVLSSALVAWLLMGG